MECCINFAGRTHVIFYQRRNFLIDVDSIFLEILTSCISLRALQLFQDILQFWNTIFSFFNRISKTVHLFMCKISIIAINLRPKGFNCFSLLIFIAKPSVHDIIIYINSSVTISQSQWYSPINFINID